MDFGHLLDKIHEEVAEDPGEMADESSSSDDDVAHENDKLPKTTKITVKMSTSVPEKGGIFDALRVDSNDPNDSLREELCVTPKIDEKNLEYIGEVLERKKSVVPFLTQTINQLALVRNEKMERAADLICTLFRLPHGSTDCSFFRLIKVLRSFGIWENDPRLKQMFDRMKKHDEENEDSRQWAMSQEKFKEIIFPCTILISRTLRNQLIIPSWLEFTQLIETIFETCRESKEGEVASYIPQLARQSPHLWGMSICTIDGQRFSLGDSKKNFCLQSVSKAFNYAIVASEIGSHVLHQYVGHEPSGRLFNEICLDSNNMPHNPLINAGAIVVTSMIKPTHSMADRFDFMLKQYRKLAGGGHVGFDNATFLSERDTADRNYALSYYMKEYRCFPDESQVYEKAKGLREELDLYFQLCSLETNCDTAAVMAATLANGGICPLTTEKCLGSRPCRDILSLMYSCGMYDYSGKFAFQVGLPAKSGVSGIMIVVIPNVMGIALYSPPLDKTGNSCRGVAFCRQLIDKFNFHNYDSLLHPDDSRKIDPRRKIGPRENETIVQVMYAAKNGDLDSLRRMFMQGADLKTADYDNRTALHVAAAEGRIKVCKFLINIVGIPHDVRDRWGRYPLDDARQFKNKEVALYLFRLQYPTKRMPENWFEVGGDLLVSELEPDNSSVDDGEAESSGEDELGNGITGMLTDDLEKREWALHANGNMGEINYQLVRRKSSKAPPTPDYKPPQFGYGALPVSKYQQQLQLQQQQQQNEKKASQDKHRNINGHGHMNGNGTHTNGNHQHHQPHQLPQNIPHHMLLNGAAGGLNTRRLSSPNEQDEDNDIVVVLVNRPIEMLDKKRINKDQHIDVDSV
ncbi:glutaminase [Caenorhabditis elegans]|uniref:glutaminase n=2 Tax=Caenorhabditis elegans TaxID=6239 RepID=U4PRW7_CAEEL|nr:glutaminase [Caenorhabditis elegans]CDH93328.1 glutaminase [Caenorhabditis elegans]|eukprot:NP_001293582.1 GLutamiNAse [Caenorhabditis elegans]